MDHRMIIQSVSHTHTWLRGAEWNENEKRKSNLVFIGKELRKESLLKHIEMSFSSRLQDKRTAGLL
jgi:G3E family GTPase